MPGARQMLATPVLKAAVNKQTTHLTENGINFDTPLSPEEVAALRVERIAKEKKQAQTAPPVSDNNHAVFNPVTTNKFFLNTPKKICSRG